MKKVISAIKLVYRFRVLLIILISVFTVLFGAFSVTKGTISEINPPSELIYGEEYSPSSSALFSKTTIQYRIATENSEWTEEKPVDAGTYLMRVVSSGFIGKRYSEEILFTISKKDLTINISGDSVIYGNNPTISTFDENGVEMLEYGDYIASIGFTYKDFIVGKQEVTPDVTTVVVHNTNNEDVTDNYNITVVTSTIDINHRPIYITPVSIEKVYDGETFDYKGDVTFSVNQLVSGHNIVVNAFYKDSKGNEVLNPINAGSYTAVIDSVGIYADEEYVTDNYVLTYLTSQFQITKRDITIVTNSATKVYDGQPLTYANQSDYHISSDSKYQLVPGHYMEVDYSTVSSITNVGETKNKYNIIIRDEDGNDVTSNYNITYDYGTLSVTSRDITVTTASASKVYDGLELSVLDGTVNYYVSSGSLAVTDYMTYSNYASITDVGSKTNEIKVIIKNENEVNVTSNYNITYLYGTLEVTHREITVETTTLSKIYDGTALTGYDLGEYHIASSSVNEVVSFHLMSVNIYTVSSITNVGTIDNKYEVQIFNGTKDVTDNYIINYIYGSLTIEVFNATVVTGSGEKVYDGQILANGDMYFADGVELPAGHKFKSLDANPYIVDVGTITNEFKVAILNAKGEDVSSNFNYDYIFGTLTITKRSVTVSAISYQRTYGNDIELDPNLYIVTESDNSTSNQLIDGGKLNLTYSIYKDMTSPATTNASGFYNAGTYYVHIESHNKALDVNYDITYDHSAALVITPRQMTISLIDYSVVYGEDYTYNPNSFTAKDKSGNSFIDDTKITVVVEYDYSLDATRQLSVGTYTVSIFDVVAEDQELFDNNYSFTTVDAELTITPLEVTINIAKDLSKVYDGEAFNINQDNYYVVTPNVLPYGETLFLVPVYCTNMEFEYTTTEIINAGTYYVTATDYMIVGGNGSVDNYKFTVDYGQVVIEKRLLTLNVISGEKVYDGEYYNYPVNYGNYHYEEDSLKLVNGAALKIQVETYLDGKYTTPKNAGTYNIIYKSAEILGDSKSNYTIKVNSGTYIIHKRDVVIAASGIQKIYGDELPSSTSSFVVLSDNGNNEYSYSLIDGSSVDLKIIYKDGDSVLTKNEYGYYDAGTYTIAISSYNQSLDKNYNVTTSDSGELIIARKNITLYVNKSIEFDYGQQFDISMITAKALSDGIIDGISPNVNVNFEYGPTGDILDDPIIAGTYFINIISHNEELDKNYKVSYASSRKTLTINPLKVNIYLNDIDTKIYDGLELDYFALNGDTYNKELSDSMVYDEELIIKNVYYYFDESYTDPITNELVIAGTFANTTKNVGKYLIMTNSYTVTGGNNSIDNYNFNFIYGHAEITERPVTLSVLAIDNMTYNANAYEYPKYHTNFDLVDGSLEIVDGELITIYVSYEDENNKPASPIEVGTYTVKGYDYVVSYGLKENYNVTILDGSVTIDPAKITIKASNTSITYGEELLGKAGTINYPYIELYNEDGNRIYGLYGAEYINYLTVTYNSDNSSVSSINELGYYNTGSYSVEITGYNSNVDLSKNYIVSYDHTGIININRRLLTLSGVSKNTTYGTELPYLETEYTYEIETGYEHLIKSLPIIVTYEFLSTSTGTKYTTLPVNYGSYYAIVTDYSHFLDQNFNVQLRNYSHIYSIAKASLSVSLRDVNDITYNGEAYEYKNEEGNYELVSGKLYYDEKLSINISFSLKGKPVEPKDAGVYDVVFDKDTGFIITGGNGNLNNYDITVINDTLTINPLEITIKPLTSTYTYDGNAFVYSVYVGNYEYIGDNRFVGEDNIQLTKIKYIFEGAEESPIEFGTYTMLIDSYEFTHGTSTNYTITPKSNELNIGKLDITLRAVDLVLNYADDATYNSGKFYRVVNEELVNSLPGGQSVKLEVVYLTSSGEVAKKNEYGFYDSGEYTIVIKGHNKDLDYNYNISYDNTAKLTINKLDLFLSLLGQDNVYGEEIYYKTNKFAATYNNNVYFNLPGNQPVSLTFDYYLNNIDGNKYVKATPINAGDYYTFITSYNSDLDKNFNVSYSTTEDGTIYGNFTVLPRTLNVSIKPFDGKEYDGDKLYYEEVENNYVLNKGYGLVFGEELTISAIFRSSLQNYNDPTIYALNAATYHVYVDTKAFTITGGNGLASNYKLVTNDYYEFTITPRKLTITLTPINDFVYGDATYRFESVEGTTFTITSGEVVFGEKINVVAFVYALNFDPNSTNYDANYSVETAIHAGNYEVRYYDIDVTGSNNLRSNYEVTCQSTRFKITSRAISVSLFELEDIVYNSNPVTYSNEYNNFTTTDTIYNSDLIKILVIYEKLVDSQWIIVTEMESHGTYRVKFANKWSLNSGYTNDYVVTALNHTEFVISKLQVEIGIINPNSYFESYYTSKEHVYDGSYTIHSSNNPTELTTLPDTATLSIGYYELIRNGDEVSKGREISAGKLVGEYYCTSKELVFNDPSVKDNYEITFVENDYSVLKIMQTEIYISLKDVDKQNKSKTYDGTRLTDVSSSSTANVNLRSSQISVKATDFLHTISADMRYYDSNGNYIAPPKNAGNYIERITNVYVDGVLLEYDAEGKYYYNDNLKIYTEDKNVSIAKKTVNIKISFESQKYDGKEYTFKVKDITYSTKDIIKGDTLTINDLKFISESVMNPGTYNIDPNSVDYDLTYLGNDVKDNYNIIFSGSLEIKERVVEISANDMSFMYTGSDIEVKNYFFSFTKDSISNAYGLQFVYTLKKDGQIVDSINGIGTYTLTLTDVLDSNGISIKESDLFDFKASYITDSTSTIVVSPYDVYVNTKSATFIYSTDIDSYYYHEFEVDKNLSHIISGHTVEVDADKSPVLTKRGVVSNRLVFKIIDANGNDVTENYNIYYGEIGTLSVVGASTLVSSNYYYNGAVDSIEAIAESLQLISDDDSLQNLEVVLEEYKLLNRRGEDLTNTVITPGSGYKLHVKVSFMLNGEVVNARDINLTNELVDEYYILDFAVIARPISMKPMDIETTYNGKAIESGREDYVVTSDLQLIEGHTAKIYTSLSVINAGYYADNKITSVSIYDANGKNVTRYYDINIDEYAIINVNPMKLFVSTSSATYYYDGSEFSSESYTIHNSLLTGHKISTDETVYTIRSAVGTSKNYVYLTIKDGKEDVTGNYKLEYVELGTITVEKSTIKVVTSSDSKEFDGSILTSKTTQVYVNGQLITGTTINKYLQITLTDYAQIEEPGSIENTVTLTVKKSGSNVTKNFDIEYEFGTLTITLTE